MDPITLSLLVGAGGAAVSNIPSLFKTKAEREQQKRLDELLRLEQEGKLGLSDKEQTLIENKLRAGAVRAGEQTQDQINQLLAGGGTATGGQSMAQAQSIEQARSQIETDVADKVLQQDIVKRQQQIDEARALEAALSEGQLRRREAVTNIGSAGLEAALAGVAQQAIMQGPRDIDPTRLNELSVSLGVTPEQARSFYEQYTINPELAQYQLMLKNLSGKGK